MDWTQVFVILGVFGAGYFHLSSKIDNLSNKIDKCAKAQDLSNLTTSVIEISRRLGVIQGQLMPKVVPIQYEKPKKKAKGE